MNKLTLKTTQSLAALAVALLAGSVYADGFYAGVNLGQSTLNHSIERNTGSATSPSITTNADDSAVSFGLQGGYKQHVSDDIYLAGEAFYNKESADTINLNNLLKTHLTAKQSYGVKAKVGFDVNDKFSVYTHIGATQLEFDINNSYPFAPPKTSDTAKETAFNWGVGASYEVAQNITVFTEYNQIKDLDFDPIPEVAVPGKVNPNNVDLSNLRLGINYNF